MSKPWSSLTRLHLCLVPWCGLWFEPHTQH
jgi:hypothetical protein